MGWTLFVFDFSAMNTHTVLCMPHTSCNRHPCVGTSTCDDTRSNNGRARCPQAGTRGSNQTSWLYMPGDNSRRRQRQSLWAVVRVSVAKSRSPHGAAHSNRYLPSGGLDCRSQNSCVEKLEFKHSPVYVRSTCTRRVDE